MQTAAQNVALSKTYLWIARVMSALAVLFWLLDGVMHMMVPLPVTDAFRHLGFPVKLSPIIGLVELACLLVYVVPRTAIFGAILLTGILGGAVTAHVRVDDPLFPTLIFPIIVGLLIWGPLYIRDERLRALIWPRS